MTLEQVSWEQKVILNLPALKKKKMKNLQVDWASSELPTVPVMVNPKPIKALTKLCLYLPEPPKANKSS